ncbi:MAG: AMP-binding protein, partial [Nitrospirae bacterium]|nr:AMP-binding protein [Nitrospirota bacterium]
MILAFPPPSSIRTGLCRISCGALSCASRIHPVSCSTARRCPSDDQGNFYYTGGATWTPKGVMLTRRNVLANALQGRNWCPDSLEWEEIFLGEVPSFHRHGLRTCQNPAMAMGSSIILLPLFHADEPVKTIHKYRVTIFS